MMRPESKRECGVTAGLAAVLVSFFLMLVATQAAAQTTASVTLAWDASPGSSIAGYYLYQGTNSHNYTQQLNVRNFTRATVTNLTPGLRYYFAVSAYDTIGLESLFSSEISYTPPLSVLPTITLTGPRNGSSHVAPATINLAATVTPNGRTITKVNFYTGATLLGTDTGAPYNFTWTNVSAGTYTLRAAAVYDSGSAVISSPFSVTVNALYDGINPNEPAQAVADSDGDGLTDLMEYALGTDPWNPTDANSALIIFITQESGYHYLAMKYKCRSNAEALQLHYLPEVSSDKLNWYSDSTHVLSNSVTPLDAQFNWVTLRDTTPITPTVARFMRLHVISGSLQVASPIWIGCDSLIQGNNATLFSQRMVRPILSAGTVAAISNSVLTDTNGHFTKKEFGTNGAPAYVEFDNGVTADIADSAAVTNQLVLAGSVSSMASIGDAYRIRAHFTVASLFGTNNETGLKAGLNPAQADNILLQIPQAQQTMTIFYFSNAVTHGWCRADYSPAADQVVYPEQGLIVRRVAPGYANLFLCGPIQPGVIIAPIEPGFNLVGTLKSSDRLTLDSLNLYTGDPKTGVASGLNLTASDDLFVVQPNGVTGAFFYFNDSRGQTGWRDSLYNPAGSTLISPGSAFIIKRQPANGSFNWTIPAE